jgi:glycosyltransferase involved in cell wall biosynthesis
MDAIINQACGLGEALHTTNGNELLQDYQRSPQAKKIRSQFASGKLEDRIRLRQPRTVEDPGRQGNLIILKRPEPTTGERGVILLKYNATFAEFPAVFDISEIGKRFHLVLEPSFTGYIEAPFFLYPSSDFDVVVQCTHSRDIDFFSTLRLSFHVVRMGGGDWVDHDLFRPQANQARDFDLVMVAAWSKLKRHHVLFRALARLKPRRINVALVGYTYDRDAAWIREQMRSFGVEDRCTLFESIPPEQVADILARSKAALLLSKLEGTNKGVYEALFCDTPIIVYRHHVGLNMDHVNAQTGMLADDGELPEVISEILEKRERFSPRQWALAHTGYQHSWLVVNDALRAIAQERREPWTRDIVLKVNRPNLRYKYEADRLAMEPAFIDLGRFLIP